ncbi:MAG TPA: membrane protein insertase YidC [candidate division Zixibacteria bacterium]|nr:membrane protein insertase YidC [candidate division Zixibacteria bacterium]
MDKKTLPLVILLVIVIIAYYPALQYFGVIQEPAPNTADTTAVAEPPVDMQADQVKPAQETLTTERPVKDGQPPTMTEPVDAMTFDTVVVHTNKYDIVMTSYGGGPVSMILKEYTLRDGNPIDMQAGSDRAMPEATFARQTFSTSQINFECNFPPGDYPATSGPLEVIYTYRNGQGGEIVRRYTFHPDSYSYDFALEVIAPETFGFERQYRLEWNSPLQVTEPQADMDYQAMEAVAMMGGSRETLNDFDDGRMNQSLDGTTTWAGVRQKYFAAVMIPHSREADGVVARGIKQKVATPDGKVERREITIAMIMPFASVESVTDSFQVFAGPLDYTLMSGYNVDLEDMLGIGTTPLVGWLIKPFAIGVIWLLPRMYDFLPNYGLVIIIFALLVKIVTMPLSAKSFRSMQAMRDIQPKLEELKVKHKKNPQALQQETMALYRKHGVNPVSGCLPMLPQMPLFFAMFSVFRSTILLRDAPFIWFIDDLSRGAQSFTDPYIILVVFMIIAQYLSQKLTMPTGGNQQNKMLTYMMPLVMGFIFYKFSAGLVLYWACFSIFSLLDYVVFKRKAIKNPEVQSAG